MGYAASARDVATELAFWHAAYFEQNCPRHALGSLGQEMVRRFRALAVMLLLSEGSADLFLHNLSRASRVRLAYLQRMRDAGTTSDFFQGASRHAGLTAALAATDFTRARAICRFTPGAIQPWEYEDDHCFGQLLCLLSARGQYDRSAVDALLERFEAFIGPQDDARLAVLRALHAREVAALAEAFDGRAYEFAADVQRARGRAQLEDPVTLALRDVDIDALALLRLAELQGLETPADVPFCPAAARRPLRAPFPAL